jgi:hypothetical protein
VAHGEDITGELIGTTLWDAIAYIQYLFRDSPFAPVLQSENDCLACAGQPTCSTCALHEKFKARTD